MRVLSDGRVRRSAAEWLRVAASPPDAARFVELPLVAMGEDEWLSSVARELSLPGGAVLRWRR